MVAILIAVIERPAGFNGGVPVAESVLPKGGLQDMRYVGS